MADDRCPDEFAERLMEAKARAALLAQSLPLKIAAASLTLESKIPFKVLSLREILIHRTSALATAAVEMFEQRRLVPAVVLARAIVETVAVTFNLHKQLVEFCDSKDVEKIDDFVSRGLVGERRSDASVKATNVLTLIDHVEKALPGFRQSYDGLSEYAHPNWSGGLGAFGRIDRKALELHLGPSERTSGLMSGVISLLSSLMLFEHYYNAMIGPIKELNDHFERNLAI